MLLKASLASAFLLLYVGVAEPQENILGSGVRGGTGSCGTCMTTPVLSWGTGIGVPSNAAINYGPLVAYSGSSIFSATLNTRQNIAGVAGTFYNLQASNGTAIAAGSYIFSLNVAGVSSALQCTMTSSATACSDSVDRVHVNQGDLLSWEVQPSGTPTALTTTHLSALFISDNPHESFVEVFNSAATSTTIAQWTGLNSYGGINSTENIPSSVFSTGGTLSQLQVSMNGGTGANSSLQFTVYKNGLSTGLTCTAVNPASSCSDLVDSVSVVQGDTISLLDCPSNGSGTNPTVTCQTATNAPTGQVLRASMRWVPTTNGYSVAFNYPATLPPTTITNHFLTLNGSSVSSTTEANEQSIAPVVGTTMTVQGVTVAQCPGPTTGTRTVTGRLAGASQTMVATTSGSTACPTLTIASDFAHPFTATSNALLGWLTTPVTSANSALTTFKIGAVVTVP